MDENHDDSAVLEDRHQKHPISERPELIQIAYLRDDLRRDGDDERADLLQTAIYYISSMERMVIDGGLMNRCHFCASPARKSVNMGPLYGGQVVHVCPRCGEGLENVRR